jgi:Tol biopolymer transport system component
VSGAPPPTEGPPTSGPPSGGGAPKTGGTGVLFEFDPDGPGGEDSEIHLLDPDSFEAHPLTDNSVPDRWPRWSPDGTLITFTRFRNGDGDIYTMDKDGGNQTPMTSGPADDRVPDFAPNKFIYFNSDRDETDKQQNDIWRVSSLRGGHPTLVVGIPGADDSSPAWSPDGKRMALTSNRDRNDGGRSIYIWEPGHNPEPLTSGGTVDRNPRWDPDGEHLVFTRNPIGSPDKRDIWSLDVGARKPSRITTDPADEGAPVYSPKGDRIAFYRRVGNAWHILMRNLASGVEQDLTESLRGDSLDPSWR